MKKTIKRPPYVLSKYEIYNVHKISSDELKNYPKHPILKEILDALPERENLGHVDVYIDDEGHLHLDFISDFVVE